MPGCRSSDSRLSNFSDHCFKYNCLYVGDILLSSLQGTFYFFSLGPKRMKRMIKIILANHQRSDFITYSFVTK